MSETVTEGRTIERPTESKFRAWHLAADAVEHSRAKSGMKYRTRCGITVGPSGKGSRKPRKAWQLSPMEPCVICRSLADEVSR